MAKTTVSIGDYVRIEQYMGKVGGESKVLVNGLRGIVVGHRISGDTIVHKILTFDNTPTIMDYIEMPLDEIHVSEITGFDLQLRGIR